MKTFRGLRLYLAAFAASGVVLLVIISLGLRGNGTFSGSNNTVEFDWEVCPLDISSSFGITLTRAPEEKQHQGPCLPLRNVLIGGAALCGLLSIAVAQAARARPALERFLTSLARGELVSLIGGALLGALVSQFRLGGDSQGVTWWVAGLFFGGSGVLLWFAILLTLLFAKFLRSILARPAT